MEIQVEITKRETIKPSTPTPHHLRYHDLCLIDQLQPESHISMILFYSNSTDRSLAHVKTVDRLDRLKTSLAETLTRFYPLAGKIRDHVLVECIDDGADFLEARVYCRLSEMLERPEQKTLSQLLPKAIASSQGGPGSLVVVQANLFGCGGMAIGVLVSHRLADAFTTSMFLQGWACSVLGSDGAVAPEFGLSSRLPPRREFSATPPATYLKTQKSVSRRYVFDASKITALKAKAASASVQKPTRVEAVSALIWRCTTAISSSKFGSLKPSKLIQMMNIRKRLVPPAAERSFGNLVWCFEAHTGDTDIELHSLVSKLRKGLEAFTDNYATKFQGDEAFSVVCKSHKEIENLYTTEPMQFFCFSSWCKFPLYETDFGWGKPTWVTIANLAIKNVIVLMDTSNGNGIEAWVSLSEEDMALFDPNNELLEFASLNPSAMN